jgi:hypothetical protein
VSDIAPETPAISADVLLGPHKTIVTSVYEISPDALEQIAQWLETRGIRTPIGNVVGARQALTQVYSGLGSPETVVTALVGSLYLRLNGAAGTTLYVKESGTGNVGWIAK